VCGLFFFGRVKFMYLLNANIDLDFTDMSFEKLLLLIAFGAFAIVIIAINGITLKWGDKEFNFGGMRKKLAKRDKDTLLKESLKRFSDDVDHETEADLYDLIEEMDSRIENVLLGDHCYFTLDKFSAIVKKELYKRVRRNSLKDRLSEDSIEKYGDKILKDVEERYALFQAKVAGAKCGDRYSQFGKIKESVRQQILLWAANARDILIGGMEKKIAKYEATKDQFRIASTRKFCCDDCIAKNKVYIDRLRGVK
jgi:hypothetical protein